MKRTAIITILFAGLLFFCLPAMPSQAQFQQKPAEQEQADGTFFEDAVSIINFVFAVVFLLSLIFLIISAVKFIVAGGSESMISSAHSTWIASVIGLSVALLGFVIVNIIRYYLR